MILVFKNSVPKHSMDSVLNHLVHHSSSFPLLCETDNSQLNERKKKKKSTQINWVEQIGSNSNENKSTNLFSL